MAARERLEHIKQAISDIRMFLGGMSLEEFRSDRRTLLAVERSFEIVSEASRPIPQDLKSTLGGDVPWRQVADLGNVLRHAYPRTSAQALWAIYTDDLDDMEQAVDRMLALSPPAPPPA